MLCVFKEILYQRNKMRVELGHQMEGYLCKNKKMVQIPPPPASMFAWGPKNKFFQKLRTQTSNKQNQAWEGYLCESGRYFISNFECLWTNSSANFAASWKLKLFELLWQMKWTLEFLTSTVPHCKPSETRLSRLSAFWSSCRLMSSRVFGAVAGIRSKVHLAISSNFLTRVFPPATVEEIKISIPNKTKRGLKSPNINATLLLLRQKTVKLVLKTTFWGTNGRVSMQRDRIPSPC